jgi:cytochrome b561
LIAKINHFLLYVNIFAITISGVLKKLYMGEKLNFFIFQYAFKNSNFELADSFYIIHIYANYLLIALVSLHILATVAHHVFFKDKILKKML